MKKMIFLATCLLFAGGINSYSKTIYYVKTNGTGNGTSWSVAAGNIQDMIDKAVTGDEVWVAAGWYYPTFQTNASDTLSKTFLMKNGVNLYGGFAGNETSIDQRSKTDRDGNGKVGPWEFPNDETYLSGNNDGVTDNWTWIKGYTNLAPTWRWSISGNSGNYKTVVTCPVEVVSETLLDGFFIIGGQSEGINTKGKTIIQNCIVGYNGQRAINNDIGTVNNCYIFCNAWTGINNNTGIINHCNVSNNTCFTTNISSGPAGIYNGSGEVRDCIVRNNHAVTFYNASNSYTAHATTYGAGIYNKSGKIDRCLIMDNTAYCFNGATGGSMLAAMVWGGALYNTGTVSNCCIFNNSAVAESRTTKTSMGVTIPTTAFGVYDGSDGIIYNTTIINNYAHSNIGSAYSVADLYVGGSGGTSINCITTNDDATTNQNFVQPTSFKGASLTDQQTEEFLQADWRLKTASKYINAGSLDNLPDWLIKGTDLAGNPRTHDGKISLGAYEYSSSSSMHELTTTSASLFPNPATEFITIQDVTAGTVTVSDWSGRTVYQQTITDDNQTINVSSWAKGMYIVTIQTDDKKIVSKMVKR